MNCWISHVFVRKNVKEKDVTNVSISRRLGSNRSTTENNNDNRQPGRDTRLKYYFNHKYINQWKHETFYGN